jgi:hypothetical protein
MGIKKVNQIKRVENLINIYRAMGEEGKEKRKLMAEGLFNVQMLAGREKPISGLRHGRGIKTVKQL